MIARVSTEYIGKVQQDRIWRNRDSFSDCLRGCLVDEVRLDMVITSHQDIDALEDFIKNLRLAITK